MDTEYTDTALIGMQGLKTSVSKGMDILVVPMIRISTDMMTTPAGNRHTHTHTRRFLFKNITIFYFFCKLKGE